MPGISIPNLLMSPVQAIAHGVNKSMDVWDASKSRQMFHFSQGLRSFLLWPGTIIPSLLQILIEKGFLISRRIFTNKF